MVAGAYLSVPTSSIPSSLSCVAMRLASIARVPLLDLRSWSVGGCAASLLLLLVVNTSGAVVGVGSDIAKRKGWSPSSSAMMPSTRGGGGGNTVSLCSRPAPHLTARRARGTIGSLRCRTACGKDKDLPRWEKLACYQRGKRARPGVDANAVLR